MPYLPYVWTAVIVMALFLEGATLSLVAVWFIPGALAALVMSLFQVPMPWQVLVFVVTSIVILLFGRLLFKPLFKKTKTNVDALIGQTLIVTEEVNNLESRGAGKLRGQMWTVRTQSDTETLAPGDQATVVAIEGVKLICTKK